MIALTLPFYFYSAIMIRRLRFQLRNHFMPGLFYSFAIGIYLVWYWFDQYVFYYYIHHEVHDYFYYLRGIWEDLSRLAFIMFCNQIASVLLAFDIKFAKFLKYFNLIFFLIYLARLFGEFFFAINEKTNKKWRNSPFFKDHGLIYELQYGFLFTYASILLNICFVLSNVKDYLPKKSHTPIYVSIFAFISGIFVLSELDAKYDSKIVFRIQFKSMSKLNYIKLIIQLIVNYSCDIPTLIIIWILSSNQFEEDEAQSSIFTYSILTEQ